MKKFFEFSFVFILIFSTNSLGGDLHLGPYLQSPSPDGITILWETTEASPGKVIFGKNPNRLIYEQSEDSMSILHQVRLENLKPNSIYYYQCLWEEKSTGTYKFKTAPLDKNAPVRMGIIADSRSHPEIFTQICREIQTYQPDIIFHSGDLVADGRKIELWKEEFFDPAKELLREIPLYPVPGNHEHESPNYYKYFPVHKGEKWWSADYGMVHLTGLNTAIDGSPDSPQYKWYVDDLKKNSNKTWRFTMFHYPLFHVHSYRPVYDYRYFWGPLILKHNVQFVITGHDHYYMRSHPIGNCGINQQGSIHIVSAGGGAPLYDVVERPYAVHSQSVHHFMILDITPKKVTVRAIAPGGKIIDSFVYKKGKTAKPEEFFEFEMYVLEKQINHELAAIIPKNKETDKLNFNTTFKAGTNFKHPVTGFYQWINQGTWDVDTTKHIVDRLNPGDPLVINFKAKANIKQSAPSPILNLHLEAIQPTNRSKFDGDKIGFKNQDLQTSLESALLLNIQSSGFDKIEAIPFYIDFFASSEHREDLMNYLRRALSKNIRNKDMRIITDYLEKNNTPENRYLLYPFYFLADDLTHLDEWEKLAEKYAPYEIEIPRRIISRITKNKDIKADFIQNWYLSNSFKNESNRGLDTEFIDEEKTDLLDYKTDRNNQEVKWSQAKTSNRGYLNFKEKISPNENVVAYAFTTIEAAEPGKVLLLLGSDDGSALWFNGKESFRKKIGRSAYPCDEIIPVQVKKGTNSILVKVDQGTGGWGLYLQVMDSKGIIKHF